jgi:hypothetical protein
MGLCFPVVDLYFSKFSILPELVIFKAVIAILTESHFKPLYTIDMKVSIQGILNIDLSCQKL